MNEERIAELRKVAAFWTVRFPAECLIECLNELATLTAERDGLKEAVKRIMSEVETGEDAGDIISTVLDECVCALAGPISDNK